MNHVIGYEPMFMRTWVLNPCFHHPKMNFFHPAVKHHAILRCFLTGLTKSKTYVMLCRNHQRPIATNLGFMGYWVE